MRGNGQKVATKTVVPVLIRVEDGEITAFPDPVKLHLNEALEWICFDGEFSCEFAGTSPFTKTKFKSTGTHVHAGPHNNVATGPTAGPKTHKYTITVAGVAKPLDPTVEADPRKRPK